MAIAATPAGAATLSCGDTVTSSVTLHSDLNCSAYTAGPALIIGAPGVTVNLGGHTILGPGNTKNTSGIYDGFSGFQAEDGTISNFAADVDVEGTKGNVLTGVLVQHLKLGTKIALEGDGVYGAYLAHAKFTHLSAGDLFTGVSLEFSQHTAVSANSMQSPYYGTFDDRGIGNSFTYSTLTNVVSDGISTFSSAGDVIAANTAAGKGASGIADEESTGLLVTGNTLNHLYDGIQLFGTSKSLISHNSGKADAYGVYAAGNTSVRFVRNTFSGGQVGIETDFPLGEVLRGNVTNGNSEFGTYVWSSNDQTSFSALLSGNTGNKNRFGLYSQFPATGSGNHASGNKVVNCFNVSCVHTASSKGTTALPPHRAPRRPALPKAMRLKH